MRCAGCVAALMLLPLAARASGVEFELSPGMLSSDARAPFLRARAGIELPYATLSIAGFDTLAGGNPPLQHQRQGSGLDAWAVALEGRLHLDSGVHQFAIGFGAGWGQLVGQQQDNGDLWGQRGFAAPYLEGTVAYRASIGSWRLGLEFTLHALNRIYDEGDFGGIVGCVLPPVNGPGGIACPEHKPLILYGLAFSLGYQLKL